MEHRVDLGSATGTASRVLTGRAAFFLQEISMTTNQFAQALGISPKTLLNACSRSGSYFGVKPIKQVNGRLLWPANELERLKGGEA